jgi:hypothetical protein
MNIISGFKKVWVYLIVFNIFLGVFIGLLNLSPADISYPKSILFNVSLSVLFTQFVMFFIPLILLSIPTLICIGLKRGSNQIFVFSFVSIWTLIALTIVFGPLIPDDVFTKRIERSKRMEASKSAMAQPSAQADRATGGPGGLP